MKYNTDEGRKLDVYRSRRRGKGWRDCEDVVGHECVGGSVTSSTATARRSRVTR